MIVLESLIICSKIESNKEQAIDDLNIEESDDVTDSSEDSENNYDTAEIKIPKKPRSNNSNKNFKIFKLEFNKKKKLASNTESNEDETSEESNESDSTVSKKVRKFHMKNVNKNGALSKFELEINSTKTLIKPKIKSKRFKFELKNTKKDITSSNKNEESIGGRYITANKREFKVQNLKAKDNLKKSTKVKIQSNIKSTKRKRYNLELCDRQENFKKTKTKTKCK